MTALFLVTSPGYTATKWLAWALNAQPRVYCNHSAGSDALERDYTVEELAALAEEKLGRRDAEPVDAFFTRLLAGAGDAAAAGNVHRYNLTALKRNLARHGAPRPFRTLNLLRHPVPWVESGARQLGRMAGAAPTVRRRLRRHFRAHRALYRELGAPTFPWPSELAFCYLCGRLARLAQEAADGSTRHVRMEDVTGDAEVLAELVGRLTGRDPDREAVRRALARGPLHRHRSAAADPAAQLRAWPAWKRAVFARWARESGIADAYAAHGYDLRLPSPPRPTAPRRQIDETDETDEERPRASGRQTDEIDEIDEERPRGSRASGRQTDGIDEIDEERPRGSRRARRRIDEIDEERPRGSRRASPEERAPLPRAVAERALGAFDPVAARDVPFRGLLEPRLRRTLDALRRHLAEAGLPARLGPRGVARFSPGVDHGAPPLLDPRFFEGEGWRAALVHPPRQDRSPALVCHHPEGLLVLNLKGAGVRTLRDSFVVRAGRCPGYLATLSADRHKPVDVLIDHPDEEWASHALVGGARLGPTLMEIRHALAWHALLLRHDGAPAATCVPLRVRRPREAWVRERDGGTARPARDAPTPSGAAASNAPRPGAAGRGTGAARARRVPLGALFADPTLSTPAQLAQVLRDLPSWARLARPRSVARFARLLRTDPASLAAPEHAALRRRVGALYVWTRRPVVYEHATRAKLRIGHLWIQLTRDAEVRARLAELGWPVTAASARRLVDALIAEVFAVHGRRLARVREADADALGAEGRFAHLRSLYARNRAAADAVLEAAGRAGGRTLGALHGTGGHCLGRRIPLRDRRGEPLRDAVGLVRRIGAPGGGSTHPRNATVAGEWVDTAHLFAPATDPLAALAAWLGRWSPRRLPWARPGEVERFQRCDVELAEESMARFDALMTGRPALVPAALDRLEDLRRERKRLEDDLRRGGGADRSRVRAIEDLERRAAALRRTLPEHEAGRALRAFRASYEAHRRRAEAREGT